MNLLPVMPEMDLSFSTQPQEQVSGFNEVRNSGSFARTLESLDQGESNQNRVRADEAPKDEINTSEKEEPLERSVQSREADENEKRAVSDEPVHDAALPLFQVVSDVSEALEPVLLVSEQSAEIGEEAQPASQLLKTVLQVDSNLKGKENAENLPETKLIAGLSEEATGISLDSLDEAMNAEAPVLKNVDLSKTGLSKVEANKTEAINTEAVAAVQNKNGDDATGKKGDQTSDDLLVKPPSEATAYETVDESLLGDEQTSVSQENFDQEKGSQQDRSTLSDDLLKLSPQAQSGSREVGISSEAIARPALALAEKAAILSQLTAQFRGLQAGKVEQLRLQLHPESLGALQVELSLQKGSLVAHILTADPRVKDLLEGNQALLRQSLAEQGFDVDGFSVDVGNAEGGFKDQETAQAFSSERSLAETSEDSISGMLRPESQMQIPGRINVYV